MTKYIVKNCPNILPQKSIYPVCALTWKITAFLDPFDNYQYCKDINNCLLKQIVEKCKNAECDCLIEKRKCGAMDNMPICCDLWRSKDILSLLEIKECE